MLSTGRRVTAAKSKNMQKIGPQCLRSEGERCWPIQDIFVPTGQQFQSAGLFLDLKKKKNSEMDKLYTRSFLLLPSQ